MLMKEILVSDFTQIVLSKPLFFTLILSSILCYVRFNFVPEIRVECYLKMRFRCVICSWRIQQIWTAAYANDTPNVLSDVYLITVKRFKLTVNHNKVSNLKL